MKTKHLLNIAALTALLVANVGPLQASSAPIPELTGMQSVGEARMRVLFWDVYDAELYAPEGAWSRTGRYALALTYLRDLKGRAIAERSIDEIRRQGDVTEATLARWQEQLYAIIPDVRDQSEIVGLADENGHTRFFLDGSLIGEIREPVFTQAFFGIWLDERTSEPALRKQLLGATQ